MSVSQVVAPDRQRGHVLRSPLHRGTSLVAVSCSALVTGRPRGRFDVTPYARHVPGGSMTASSGVGRWDVTGGGKLGA